MNLIGKITASPYWIIIYNLTQTTDRPMQSPFSSGNNQRQQLKKECSTVYYIISLPKSGENFPLKALRLNVEKRNGSGKLGGAYAIHPRQRIFPISCQLGLENGVSLRMLGGALDPGIVFTRGLVSHSAKGATFTSFAAAEYPGSCVGESGLRQ